MEDLLKLAEEAKRSLDTDVGFGEASDRQEFRKRLQALEALGELRPAEAEALKDLNASTERDEDRVDSTRAFGRGVQKGVTFNLTDEAAGLFGGADARDAVRARDAAAQEAHPTQFGAGELTGAVGTSAGLGLGAARLLKGGSALKNTLQAAGVGGAEGAVYGFADGQGLEDRTGKGFHGGLVGAGAGAAAPAAAKAVQKVGGAIKGPISGVVDALTGRANPNRANKKLGQMLNRSGQTTDELEAALRAAEADGQGMFTLADAMGNSGQRGLSGVLRQPGEYRQEIIEALNQRQVDQADRIGSYLADSFGSETATAGKARMTAERGAAADVNYGAARQGASPVDIRGALGVIDARTGGIRDSGVTGDSIDASLEAYRNRLMATDLGNSNLAEDGVSSVELSDFDRVLGVKQDLQDEIGAATRAGQANKARELRKLHSEIDAALEAASPKYRTANDEFARASREIDAVDTGASMPRTGVRASDNAATFGQMTPAEQESARLGIGNALAAKVESAAVGANKARPLTSTKLRDEFSTMAESPDQLARRVDRENTMFETRNQAVGGSQTANNLSDMDDVNTPDVGLVANVLASRWGAAATDAARSGSNVISGQNEATRALIAKALMSKDPKAIASNLVRQGQSEARSRRVIEALMRQGVLQGTMPQ